MVFATGKTIFVFPLVALLFAFAFSLGMGALYAKNRQKITFHIEKIYGHDKFCLSKGILWGLLLLIIKTRDAGACARLSQNNSQVKCKGILTGYPYGYFQSYVLYKSCFLSYIRLP
jgi:hypothetical protein